VSEIAFIRRANTFIRSAIALVSAGGQFYESDCQGQISSLLIAFSSCLLQSAPSDPKATAESASGRAESVALKLRLLTMTTDDQQNVWGSGRLRPTAVASSRYDIVWFDSVPVAQLTGGTTWTGTFTDHLGTPILQFDASSTITWRAEYEPYGDLWQLRAGDSRYDQPLRFPGQEVAMTWEGHEENYNVFRWYASGRGRYTSPDPIGIASLDGDKNLFSYALANPLKFVDPAGLCATCDQCPSGEWNFNNAPGFGVSLAAIAGGSVTWGTYVCKDNGREVKVRIDCVLGGPIVGLGIGGQGPVGLAPMACACNENGLFGQSRGTTGWIGPVNVDTGTCATKAGGRTGGAGFSKSWGAGFAWTKCTTKKVN